MKDLSLNLLDIAENSVKAGATLTRLLLTQEGAILTFQVADDGCGMTEEALRGVTDPFYTTRTTRKVGMGLPLYRMAAEQTGGSLAIESTLGVGTTVTASFGLGHIDRPPMGDVVGAWFSLVLMNPDTDFLFTFDYDGKAFTFDTRIIRETVAPLPLNQMEIADWIKDCLSTEINELHGGNLS